ncbi:MAG: hypothetical protein ACRDLR_03235 [Gaiellaceae bacterium]
MTGPTTATGQLDEALRRRLAWSVASDAHADWRDVRQRARREHLRRDPRRLAVAVVVAGMLIAAPALAIATGVIDFSNAPAAPEPVKVLFDRLPTLTGPNIPQGIATEDARLVYTFETASARYQLVVAPARDGGWCWAIVGRSATCNTPTTGLNYDYNPPPPVPNEADLIEGSIAAQGVTRVAVRFENGSLIDVPFVHVSAPIDADFFLYPVPPAHWNQGTRPSTIAAYDAEGTIVGAGWFIREADMPVVGTKG